MKNLRIEKALRAIAAKHHGMLLPEAVVAEAKNPKHPLHSRFTWENTEAAHQWRLHEARNLIRVCVEVVSNDVDASPVFVSLSSDRSEGNGYRITAEVMQDSDLRDQLLKDALADLNVFSRRYANLKELAEIFAAIRKVKQAA